MATHDFSLGVGIGVVIGGSIVALFLLKGRARYLFTSGTKQKRASDPNVDLTDSSPGPSDTGEYKMVIVVRTDLKMGKGKAAAQCAHGALGAAEKAFHKDQDALLKWKACGQPKVVVKTDTQESLEQLAKTAASAGLICSIIRDAGRTQIPSGSKTVLAVGPGPAHLVDKVTGHLKLY